MANEPRQALVTGGSSGVGFGIAKALIGAGYCVTLIGRNEGRLREAAKTLGVAASWRRADVGRREEVQATIAGLDRVDLLVNAAGFLRHVSLATPAEEAEANWDAVVNANLKGSFLMVHTVAPLLTSPGGRIINISSIRHRWEAADRGAWPMWLRKPVCTA